MIMLLTPALMFGAVLLLVSMAIVSRVKHLDVSFGLEIGATKHCIDTSGFPACLDCLLAGASSLADLSAMSYSLQAMVDIAACLLQVLADHAGKVFRLLALAVGMLQGLTASELLVFRPRHYRSPAAGAC